MDMLKSKEKLIKQVAYELLESKFNNGFGIKCEAVTDACNKHNINFQDLWKEVVKQGNREE